MRPPTCRLPGGGSARRRPGIATVVADILATVGERGMRWRGTCNGGGGCHGFSLAAVTARFRRRRPDHGFRYRPPSPGSSVARVPPGAALQPPGKLYRRHLTVLLRHRGQRQPDIAVNTSQPGRSARDAAAGDLIGRRGILSPHRRAGGHSPGSRRAASCECQSGREPRLPREQRSEEARRAPRQWSGKGAGGCE